MQNKLSFCLLAVIAAVSIHTVAYASLWNLSETVYTYNGSDKLDRSWIYKISISPVSGKDYYKATTNNYENDGEENELFITSNETSVQYSFDGSTWEYWIDKNKNTGDSTTNFWITTEIDNGTKEYTKRTVGYDNILKAYFVENYEVNSSGERLSKSDIYYFADGLGMVYEYDERGVDPSIAPLEQLRTDWSLPTTTAAVPAPTTLLLFSAGLLSLTAVRRRRAK